MQKNLKPNLLKNVKKPEVYADEVSIRMRKLNKTK